MNDDQMNNGTQASELYSKVEEAIIGAQASQVYQGARQNNHDEDDDDKDDDDDDDDDDEDVMTMTMMMMMIQELVEERPTDIYSAIEAANDK